MAKADFNSVDDYIDSQPEAVRGILELVRSTIRKAIPQAQDVISYKPRKSSYKMPTYLLHGDRLLYFAVSKQHYSIYAATERVLAAFQIELASYEVEKGTIRVPLSKPVPVKLIGRIVKFRAREVAERAKAGGAR